MQNKKHHRGQIAQIPIYLGKFFRMFVFLDDWKVLPMGAVIAGLVTYVIRGSMFSSMEGTLKGSLAISCVCVWNGCFNSIQVVCRERGIIKREHRSGMHVTSYIISHMIYQAFLCLLQTGVTLAVFKLGKLKFPSTGAVTPYFIVDLFICIFLITYASDMLSLLLSSIAKTTTAAMTIMPFVLIFELVFSGSMFSLSGTAEQLTNLSIARWGIQCICSESEYNDLPLTSAWTMISKLENIDYTLDTTKYPISFTLDGKDYTLNGTYTTKDVLDELKDQGMKDAINKEAGKASYNARYEKTADNVKNCWFCLILFSLIEALASVLILERIDKDKR